MQTPCKGRSTIPEPERGSILTTDTAIALWPAQAITDVDSLGLEVTGIDLQGSVIGLRGARHRAVTR